MTAGCPLRCAIVSVEGKSLAERYLSAGEWDGPVDRKSPKRPPATEVEIFGAVYSVRGRDDSEYLQELAALVDRTMREVAAQVTTVDTVKIAILAALNIADELSQCRRQREGVRVVIEEKATALTGELAAALDVETSPARKVAYR